MMTKWLSVYPCMNHVEENELVGFLFDSRESAEHGQGGRRLACIPVDADRIHEASGITVLLGDMDDMRAWNLARLSE